MRVSPWVCPRRRGRRRRCDIERSPPCRRSRRAADGDAQDTSGAGRARAPWRRHAPCSRTTTIWRPISSSRERPKSATSMLVALDRSQDDSATRRGPQPPGPSLLLVRVALVASERPSNGTSTTRSVTEQYDLRSMSAPALAGAPVVADRRHALPRPAADAPRPAPAPRGGDRLAAGARAGRVRLPAVDRADPRLARGRRDPRGRDRVPRPAGAHVAGERAAHGERRRVRPARAGHRARRLVEHERLVDLRRDVRGRAAVEVPRPGPRPARLQPVELRPRSLLPAARRGASGSARAVVGAAVARARPRPRADRRGRLPHPPAAAPRRGRGRVLARVRGRDRSARRERAHDDGGLARRADRGRGVLVAARLLAGDPRLPLLHDHRPEDDSGEPTGPSRLRRRRRTAGDAADRAVQTTEFATKVAILAALFFVCATRGAIELVGATGSRSLRPRRRATVVGAVALAGALAYAGLVVAAGIPARPDASRPLRRGRRAGASGDHGRRLATASRRSTRRPRRPSRATSSPTCASRPRLCERARTSIARPTRASGAWLATLWQRIRASGTSSGELDDAYARRARWSSRLLRGDDAGTAERASRALEGTSPPSEDGRARARGRALPHRALGGRRARS